MPTRLIGQVLPGEELPVLTVQLTPSRIVAGAIATGDFEPIHHDRSAAERVGRKDVFMNILTTNGFMQRCVTDWAGPEARVLKIRLRLSGGSVAGETFKVRGRVVSVHSESAEIELEGASDAAVVARAWITVELPRGCCGAARYEPWRG